MYSDEQIDIGVILLAGAFVTTWEAINLPQYPLLENPIPEEVLKKILYVLDYSTPLEVKYGVEDLYVTRTGQILEDAFTNLEELVGESTISKIPLSVNGGPVAEQWIVCVGNVITYDLSLETAKWKAAGIWKILSL